MASHMSIRLNETLSNDMKLFPEINWSVIVRKALEEKVEEQKKIKEILNEVNLSEQEGDELIKKIRKGVAKKHMRQQ